MPISQVVPQLFIGDIKGAEDLDTLRSHGITHIVQAMGGMSPVFPGKFNYRTLDIVDSPSENIAKHFDSVNSWISSAIDKGGRVLVHW